ncbi:MAG TPA: cytoplasmic protein, partial [Acidimicrobiaceae bacterium]|nr:cytoplasmic protein [Acidimicrobiaceae bacterium]
AGRPAGRPTGHRLRTAVAELGVLQIDAVNAVARSHLLVLRPRVGGDHDTVEARLAQAAYSGTGRTLTEYWCHEAGFCTVDDWPLYRWRMRRAAAGEMWPPLARYAAEHRRDIDAVRRALGRHGPASATELDEAAGTSPARPARRPGQWWHWTDTKKALGWLFWTGRIGVAERVGFRRRYDLIERVLPAEVLERRLDDDEAQRELLLQAARCLGVAGAADLIDYHRLAKSTTPALIAELVADGRLRVAAVEGWDREAYVLPGVRVPRGRSQSVLLSPFDPLVWFRPRAERLFGFEYRLEIYTPAAKRRYGYYVLPFLHDGRPAARADVRSDRRAGVLRVHGVFGEPSAAADAVPALASELRSLAAWLGLDDVALDAAARGDLAPAVRAALRSAA